MVAAVIRSLSVGTEARAAQPPSPCPTAMSTRCRGRLSARVLRATCTFHRRSIGYDEAAANCAATSIDCPRRRGSGVHSRPETSADHAWLLLGTRSRSRMVQRMSLPGRSSGDRVGIAMQVPCVPFGTIGAPILPLTRRCVFAMPRGVSGGDFPGYGASG